MLTVLNLFTFFQPKVESQKPNEVLITAQESSELSDLELENRQLKTAVSYCDVVTAREPKITESHVLHTNDLIENYQY